MKAADAVKTERKEEATRRGVNYRMLIRFYWVAKNRK